MCNSEDYFEQFRKHVVGLDHEFQTPYGKQNLLYADYTASGRLYLRIEEQILHKFGQYVANTHTESNITSTTMNQAYKYAQQIIKRHVHADFDRDVLISSGTGMTGAMNRFQRILGLRINEKFKNDIQLSEIDRPVVFISHMEHHSNHTTWLETIADVIVIQPNEKGRFSLKNLREKLNEYSHRKMKIGSFTACSNVTGIQTPYHQIARVMHEFNGVCFIDFSASAPYVEITMRPEDPMEKLDAMLFSPHKFLGGPGTNGILIFDKTLYHNKIPDDPGGGTVTWTNPWGGRSYYADIEQREDGGTSGFLQMIKTALCIQLKEKMGVKHILKREKELVDLVFDEFDNIPEIHILDGHVSERLGIISFYVDGIHYNLMTRILNDRYGIQVRGGCSCAGTYGHLLLRIDPETSKDITDLVDQGYVQAKPGWIRLSLHPIMTIVQTVKDIIENIKKWEKDYTFNEHTHQLQHRNPIASPNFEEWFRETVDIVETRGSFTHSFK